MINRVKDKPLVSVVVPVYNMEAYLTETLDSVVHATYPNLEVVIVDDGSRDRSLEIARSFAEKYDFVAVHAQPNEGAVSARNKAISLAHGIYILPVDADNKISASFIEQAVAVMEENNDVKVVVPSAEFIGDRTGTWHLPDFSLGLLARRNILDTCGLFRKKDWERVGGYNREIIAREDWEFWISMLKDGGRVVKLPETGLFYRVRAGSKRVSDRKLKKHVVKVLNKLHPEFFQRELGGKLHTSRSLSRMINHFLGAFSGKKMKISPDYPGMSKFIYTLPERFETEGEVIYKGRNELRKFEVDGEVLIVKCYRQPIFFNRFIYGLFRSSKAERSYEYAQRFLASGIGTPAPVGFITERKNFLLKSSYFVSLKSTCDLQYTDFKKQKFEHEEEILEAIGQTTARMHERGFLHKDYSAGNILFRDEVPVPIEIIDLNRMRFHNITMKTGCKNFERLPGSSEMFARMGRAYARSRKMNEKKCISLIQKFHE